MKFDRDRTWMEVDLGALERNYLDIAGKIGDHTRLMAVLKANAYGMGAVPMAKELERLGCPILSVAFAEEAQAIRDSGVKLPILLLGPLNPEHAALAARENYIVPLVSLPLAEKLSAAAAAAGVTVRCHVKLDTGLSRLGIVTREENLREVADEVEAMAKLPGLSVEGVFTHLIASAAPGGKEFDLVQIRRFDGAVDLLRRDGLSLETHCFSTHPAVDYPQYDQYDYVRVSALLFGSDPGTYGRFSIEPIVSLKSRVWQVKDVPAGSHVSYGPLFSTMRESRLAIVPIGFSDGLRRSLSNTGYLLVRGKKAPIVGKICCDHTILDVTDIPGVEEGDVVTVIGRDGELFQSVADLARLYPASVSEVTACFTSRIPRFFVRDGEIVDRD